MGSRASKPLSSLPVGRTILYTVVLVAAAAGLVLEFTLLKGYASHWWNRIPAFYLLYGGLAAGLLILVTDGLGRILVRPVASDETSETPS